MQRGGKGVWVGVERTEKKRVVERWKNYGGYVYSLCGSIVVLVAHLPGVGVKPSYKGLSL